MPQALSIVHPPATDAATVVTGALARSAQLLGLNQTELAAVLGLSKSFVSRMLRGQNRIELQSVHGQLALVFLNAYRSLHEMVGGDDQKASAWLRGQNTHFKAAPLDMMKTVTGLLAVDEYLAAVQRA